MDPVIENRDLVNQIHLISYLSSAPRWCAAPGREVRAACRSPHLAGWPLASPLPSPAPRFARGAACSAAWVAGSWLLGAGCLRLPACRCRLPSSSPPGPGQSGWLVASRASSVRRRRLPPLPLGAPDADAVMRRCAI